MRLGQALMEEMENREYREMIKMHGVNDEITQIAKIRYLQKKDYDPMPIYRTRHAHTGMVMQKLYENGNKKRIFNQMRLMRKQERDDSGITVSDEQEVVKEVERLWGN